MADRWYARCEIWPWEPEGLADGDEKEELLAVVGAYPAPFSGDPRVKADPGRGSVLVLEDDQAAYGVAQFDETDRIPELCRSLGLSYHLIDDGRYEHDGSDETWVPGMEVPRERARLASGAIALSADEFGRLVKLAHGDDELGHLVRAYFA